jgi:hypothetical protein
LELGDWLIVGKHMATSIASDTIGNRKLILIEFLQKVGIE